MRKSQKSPARQVALPFRRFQLSCPIHSFRLTLSLAEGPSRTNGLEKICPLGSGLGRAYTGNADSGQAPIPTFLRRCLAALRSAQETGIQIDHFAVGAEILVARAGEPEAQFAQLPMQFGKARLAII